MQIVWPSKQFRDNFLEATISAIGRPVDFIYSIATSGCPICSLNPVTQLSVDAFCPTCSGEYWIDTYGTATISGHVTWKVADNQSFYTGGRQFEGDCKVRLNYSESLITILDSTVSVIVDGRDMQIDKYNLLGAPEINRIIITLLEREKENE